MNFDDDFDYHARHRQAVHASQQGNHAPRAIAISQPASPFRDENNPARQLRAFTIALALFAFLIAMLAASTVRGQDDIDPDLGVKAKYESLPLDDRLTSEAAQKKMISALRNFASSGKMDNILSTYFFKYVPGQMTAPDANMHIGRIVGDLDQYLTRAEKSNRGGAYAKMSTAIYQQMGKIAVGNYHPNSRIAAISLLSRLNDQALNTSAGRPPVPYRKALPILVNLYLDEKNVDGVRAAALDGIHRHVMLTYPNIKGAGRAKLIAEMTKLLDAETPDGRSEKAHAYLQRYAVDILTVLRDKNDPALGVKLISLSASDERPSLIALHSAASAGSMSKELAGKVNNSGDVMASWAKRTADSFAKELDRFKSMKPRKPAPSQPRDPKSFLQDRATQPTTTQMMEGDPGMEMDMGQIGRGSEPAEEEGVILDPMMAMMEAMGGRGGPAAEDEYQEQPATVIASRRQLNYVLQQIHMAATGSAKPEMPGPAEQGGLMVAVPDADKQAVQDWAAKIEEVIKAINDPALDTEDKYLEGVEEQLQVIRGLLPAEMQIEENGGELGLPGINGDFDLDSLDDPLEALDG